MSYSARFNLKYTKGFKVSKIVLSAIIGSAALGLVGCASIIEGSTQSISLAAKPKPIGIQLNEN